MKKIFIAWIAASFIVFAFSYAFIDQNIQLFGNVWVDSLFQIYRTVYFAHRSFFAAVFVLVLAIYTAIWIYSVRHGDAVSNNLCSYKIFFLGIVLLIFAYPFLSYDLFNYMTTAKVAFTWHENPYVVMPVEITQEPYLAFTRAANKYALYGPTWILFTYLPHVSGLGSVWLSIVAFKSFALVWYFAFSYLIFRTTNNMKNVLYFALNPLIVFETIVSGHNDIVMITLALSGLIIFSKGKVVNWVLGMLLYFLSITIKGATIVLIPLFLLTKKYSLDQLFFFASLLLFAVFAVAGPIREELYPWYAVWFFSAIALLPHQRYAWMWQFGIVLAIGLELRHVPYMVMGYYEGPGPIARTILTISPVVVWLLYTVYRYCKNFIRNS